MDGIPMPAVEAPAFTGFGRLPTGPAGDCVFQTIKPGVVRTNGIEQAPHINVCLLARGLLRQIYTRIYFKGDPALATDPILALVPADRRSTLLAEPSASEPGLWEFVIRLQGERGDGVLRSVRRQMAEGRWSSTLAMSLLDCLATTDPLAAIFSDDSIVAAMLEFESALARAAAAAGVIPATAARTISEAALRGGFDTAAIARAARTDATPAIPLVKALRERVHLVDPASATYVHWGATSQDVTDTALVLLLEQARVPIAADHGRLDRALRDLSERHAATVMLGRTLLQPATPITFGLKVAGWTSAITHSWRRLHDAWSRALVIQFGGAAGTLAALDDQGLRVVAETARELDLRAVAAVAHQPRSARRAGDGLRTLRGRARQGRPRHHPADAGRSRRGRRTWWRIVDDAAQAEPVTMHGGAGGGDAHAGARRRVPDGDDPGARAQHRRQPGRVADRRRGSAGDRSGGERACRRRRGPLRRSAANAAEPRGHRRHHLRLAGGGAAGAAAGTRPARSGWSPRPSRRAAGVGRPFAGVLRASLGDAVPGDLLAGIDRPEDCLGAADTLRTWLLNEPEE